MLSILLMTEKRLSVHPFPFFIDKGLLPLEDYVSDDESAFPTLEQAAEAAKEAGEAVHNGRRKFTQPEVCSLPYLFREFSLMKFLLELYIN